MYDISDHHSNQSQWPSQLYHKSLKDVGQAEITVVVEVNVYHPHSEHLIKHVGDYVMLP